MGEAGSSAQPPGAQSGGHCLHPLSICLFLHPPRSFPGVGVSAGPGGGSQRRHLLAPAGLPSAEHRGVGARGVVRRGESSPRLTGHSRGRGPSSEAPLLQVAPADVGRGVHSALPRPSQLSAEVMWAPRHPPFDKSGGRGPGRRAGQHCRSQSQRSRIWVTCARDRAQRGGGGHGIVSGGRVDVDVVENQGRAEGRAGASRQRPASVKRPCRAGRGLLPVPLLCKASEDTLAWSSHVGRPEKWRLQPGGGGATGHSPPATARRGGQLSKRSTRIQLTGR